MCPKRDVSPGQSMLTVFATISQHHCYECLNKAPSFLGLLQSNTFFLMTGDSSVQDTNSLNVGKYLSSGFETHDYNYLHAEVELSNTDVRVVHGYRYVVKASVNGKAGTIC